MQHIKRLSFLLLTLLIGAVPAAYSQVQASEAAQLHQNAAAVDSGFITSKDGTRIAYTKFGSGTPVVVSYGAYTLAKDWEPVAQLIARNHTVYTYDRRGHGRSPYQPGKAYTFNSEIDDLAGIVALAGPNSTILGHSFGGGVSLAYALRDSFKGKLIVYEPGFSVPNKTSRGHLPALQALVRKGDLKAATLLATEKIARLPAKDIEAFRKSPLWPGMLELSKAFANEVWMLDQMTWTREQFSTLRCQTTLLIGSETVPPAGETSRLATLVDRIPGLTVLPLPGQGHVAYLSNPELLSGTVERCIEAPAEL